LRKSRNSRLYDIEESLNYTKSRSSGFQEFGLETILGFRKLIGHFDFSPDLDVHIRSLIEKKRKKMLKFSKLIKINRRNERNKYQNT
jgi:hypothetical protein